MDRMIDKIQHKLFDMCLSKMVFLAPTIKEVDALFDYQSTSWKEYYACNLVYKKLWPLKIRHTVWVKIRHTVWGLKNDSEGARYISFTSPDFVGTHTLPWDSYLRDWYLLHQSYLSEKPEEPEYIVAPLKTKYLTNEQIKNQLTGDFLSMVSDSFERELIGGWESI